MRVDLFDFDLPPERIALRPAVPRESARLLEVRSATEFVDRRVGDLPELFAAGDVLVVNDTRVIPARLSGTRTRNGVDARVEVTLHKREAAESWRAFIRPAKKLLVGERLAFGGATEGLAATCEAHYGDGEVLLAFSEGGDALDNALLKHGSLPLPPYIAGKRPIDDRDCADYQTLFAREPGAVAAPTASLHFTTDLVNAIEARGVRILRLTLHVGAGTFLPVKADDTDDHRMHAEWGRLEGSAAAMLNEARRAGGRVIAAGTTSLRLLESAARDDGTVAPFEGDTSIFITPGYRFRATDMLLTNFHLPRSTLFMLVAAFSGLDTMKSAYEHAIAEGYRFYSYGDASLLHRSTGA